jgi:hypothetical protein
MLQTLSGMVSLPNVWRFAMTKSNEIRELNTIELEFVAGGFADDNGCCPVLKWGPWGGPLNLPHGPNPWLTYGSAERGGK